MFTSLRSTVQVLMLSAFSLAFRHVERNSNWMMIGQVGKVRNARATNSRRPPVSRVATPTSSIRLYASSGISSNNNTVESLPPIPSGCHRVIMMRHGESEFNNANIFTGWCDVALTQRGIVEACEAGQVFRSHDLQLERCTTSVLSRSIITAQRALEAAGLSYTPLHYDWRWNERHYGALQGLAKDRTAERLGRERTMAWRRSYRTRPPPMRPGHPHFATIARDARYRGLSSSSIAGSIPQGESLADCQDRVVKVWEEMIHGTVSPPLSVQSNSLIVAHANTLRALIMHLDCIPETDIEGLNIPTAIPLYYDIRVDSGRTDDNKDDSDIVEHADGQGSFRGIYITNERNQRNFLQRRRAANDPLLWALHDHQVERSMLIVDDDNKESEATNSIVSSHDDASINHDEENNVDAALADLEKEAKTDDVFRG